MKAFFLCALGLAVPIVSVAQLPETTGDSQGKENSGAQAVPSEDTERTALNLLGKVDSAAGEGRRNENVRITLIDNNVLRELTARMGTTATLPMDLRIEQRYFATEFGQPPKPALRAAFAPLASAHGELRWSHQNSATRCTLLLPGRQRAAGPRQRLRRDLWEGAVEGRFGDPRSQPGARRGGNVNGNVLVPAPDERTPLAIDSPTRAYVQRLLDAYPKELPNRTDINPRALNTNAPQSIDNDRAAIRLRQTVNSRDQVVLQYSFRGQKVDAFQLVGGQNPDTTTKNHVARIGWNRNWSARTITDFTVGYERVSSLIVPEESAVGPLILTGFVIEFLGPSSSIPIDRALNRFQYAAQLRHRRGNHDWTVGAGGDPQAGQRVRGREPPGTVLLPQRLRQGRHHEHSARHSKRIPSGDRRRSPRFPELGHAVLHRQSVAGGEFADAELGPALRASHGSARGVPTDGDSVRLRLQQLRSQIRVLLRTRPAAGVWRGTYTIQYGQIFDVTYGQSRFSPPANINIALQAPDLVNPLARLAPGDLDPNARSTVFRLDPELATPYSHQYGLSWQLPLVGDMKLDLGYVGSRTHKLLTMWVHEPGTTRGRDSSDDPHRQSSQARSALLRQPARAERFPRLLRRSQGGTGAPELEGTGD